MVLSPFFYASRGLNIYAYECTYYSRSKMPKRFSTETNTYMMLRVVPVEVDHCRNHQNGVLSLCIASHHLAGAESAMPQLSVSPFFKCLSKKPFWSLCNPRLSFQQFHNAFPLSWLSVWVIINCPTSIVIVSIIKRIPQRLPNQWLAIG